MSWFFNVTTFIIAIGTLASCASSSREEVRESARHGITVIAGESCQPRYVGIGTTVFNNRGGTIREAGFSYPEFLVSELRRRGYKADLSESASEGGILILSPKSDYQYPAALGGGLYRRSLFGMSNGIWPFCNYSATYVDKERQVRRGQPWRYGGGPYFWGESDVDPATGDWSKLTQTEIDSLRRSSQTMMKEAADVMLKDLGL